MHDDLNELNSAQQNFAILGSEDRYSRYFKLLGGVFGQLLRAAGAQYGAASFEALALEQYLNRMLFTVELLRIKYTYRKESRRSLWVDLSESGFPNFAEFDNLRVELADREGRLIEVPAKSILKRCLLDQLMEQHRDPADILAQLSERTYLEMLDESQLFLPFLWGGVKYIEHTGENRKYECSWACFDFQSNCPYIHHLVLEQDGSEPPLDEHQQSLDEWRGVVQAQGSRVPPVGVLALGIDDAIETVHPKLLRRTCLGPLYSPLLFAERDLSALSAREGAVCELLLKAAAGNDDYLLFWSDYIVFSKRQQSIPGGLLSAPRTREVFSIDESTQECCEQKASLVRHSVVLPHRLLQLLTPAATGVLPEFERARKITVGESGEIYGI